jgi:hypothetical protein
VVRSLQVLTVLLLQSGKTALMEASDRGHTEVVQALIGAGANPNLQDEVRGGPRCFAPINRVSSHVSGVCLVVGMYGAHGGLRSGSHGHRAGADRGGG